MGTLLNKSNHPVLIKKIPISAWTLRAEIEACIKDKIEANGGSTDNLDISDIQEFYSNLRTYDDLPNEADEEDDGDDAELDPSGNPMDDDAKAMMEAMGGGAEADEEASDDTSEDTKEESSAEANEESSEEDDEAAKMAAEMLAGQAGGAGEENSEEDDEAAKMAAEMLAGQGGDTPQSADANNSSESKDTGFKRKFPKKKERNHGFLFLSDINMEQALIFTREKYTTGSNIVIELNVPKKFTLSAEVMNSFAVNRNSRVISDTKPNYRLQCKLHFSFEAERTNLREFLKQVEPDVPPPPSKLKKPVTENEEEDEFDDLGF